MSEKFTSRSLMAPSSWLDLEAAKAGFCAPVAV